MIVFIHVHVYLPCAVPSSVNNVTVVIFEQEL